MNTVKVLNKIKNKEDIFVSENKVFPYLSMQDFRPDLIAKARRLAMNQIADHPWGAMTDEQLIKSSQMYLRDYQTGKEGFTLASVLIFGKDDVLLSVLPHHKTDAILRQINLDRYDDRDDIRTNLIESYERLLAFVQKHLSDPFHLEGSTRISLRDQIFREVVANLLIHREFLNPYPAKLIIEQKRVVTENSNRPHGYGLIKVNDFSPYPKNPVIAQFFKQIGWADELGSGVRKLFRYSKIYGGAEPILEEKDIFKAFIPLNEADIKEGTPQVTGQVAGQVTMQVQKLLEVCDGEMSRSELQEKLSLKHRDYFNESYLNPALNLGYIEMTIPDKPTSSKQRYRLTEKGKGFVQGL